MTNRSDDRIEMNLPCRVLFPSTWSASLGGVTANLHRNGVSVACQVNPGRNLPALGETASVHIELPANSFFPPKFMRCDTTLLRIDELGNSHFQFAMQIRSVDFDDLSAEAIELMEMDSKSCRYLM